MNKSLRLKRHKKIRKYLAGTAKRPRLAIFRSNRHIFGQIIDDVTGKTLASNSDLKIDSGVKREKAYVAGKVLAEIAINNNIKEVVFDRGGFLYHGRVERFAAGARDGGLKF